MFFFEYAASEPSNRTPCAGGVGKGDVEAAVRPPCTFLPEQTRGKAVKAKKSAVDPSCIAALALPRLKLAYG